MRRLLSVTITLRGGLGRRVNLLLVCLTLWVFSLLWVKKTPSLAALKISCRCTCVRTGLHRNVHIHIFLAIASSAFSNFKTFLTSQKCFHSFQHCTDERSSSADIWDLVYLSSFCSRGGERRRLQPRECFLTGRQAASSSKSWKTAHLSSIHRRRLLGSHSHLLEPRSPLILPVAVARKNLNYTRLIFIPVASFPLATELDCCMEDVHFPLVGAVSGEDSLILLIMQKDSCSQTNHKSFFHHDLKQPQRWWELVPPGVAPVDLTFNFIQVLIMKD